MQHDVNELGQPIGVPLASWREPPALSPEVMEGSACRLEPLDPALHVESLFDSNALDTPGKNWTYLAYGPFDKLADYRAWMVAACCGEDPLFYAVLDQETGRAVGIASYLRINPSSGSVEIGHINFSPALQRTTAATEALFLMIDRVFAQGYRRCEWKCDALNAGSGRAAQRLGFSFEGVFRQATVYKGRNRDTGWYAIVDTDWPALHEAFKKWLAPENLDENGEQRLRLSELTKPLLKSLG